MITELPPAPIAEQQRGHNFDHINHMVKKIAGVILTVGAVLSPPVAGALAATEMPSKVEIAPGISGEASLQIGDNSGTSINFGAIGKLNFPNADKEISFLGLHKTVGVSIRLNPVVIPKDTDTKGLGTYSALLTGGDTVVKPIEDALVTRAVEGAAVGAAVSLGAWALLKRKSNKDKQRKEGEVVLEAHIANVKEKTAERNVHKDVTLAAERALQSLLNIQNRRPQNRNYATGTKFAAIAALAGVASGVLSPSSDNEFTSPPTSIDQGILGGNTLFKDASTEGTGLTKLLEEVVNSKKEVDNFYKQANVNFNKAFQQFEAEGGMDYLKNSKVSSAFAVSDIHCNYAYMNMFLGNIARKFKPSFAINTGDTLVSAGEVAGEETCMSNFLNQLQPSKQDGRIVETILANGNHDKKEFSSEIVDKTFVDKNGRTSKAVAQLGDGRLSTTIDDITFVGYPDGRRSIINQGTIPVSDEEQGKMIAEDGAKIADEACKIQKETGKTPAGVAHDPRALYESIMRGCISSALAGHTHVLEKPSKFITANGSVVITETNGTASGAGANAQTEYAAVTKPEGASQLIQLFDTQTNTLIASIVVMILPDASVTINRIETASAPIDSDKSTTMSDFLNHYGRGLILGDTQLLSTPSASLSRQ